MSDTPEIEVEQRECAVIVSLYVKDLDERHMRQLMADIAAAEPAAGNLPFILNLASVKFLPSMALGTLVRLSGDFRTRKQRLILAGVQPQIKQVIALTHLEHLFETQDDVDTALDGLAG